MKTITPLMPQNVSKTASAFRSLRCLGALLLSFCAAFSVHRMAEDYSPEHLTRRAIARRAVEAVIWGMPEVNYHIIYQEMVRKTNGIFNQVLARTGAGCKRRATTDSTPRNLAPR